MTQAPARFDHIRRVDVIRMPGHLGANLGHFIQEAETAYQPGGEGAANKKREWPG